MEETAGTASERRGLVSREVTGEQEEKGGGGGRVRLIAGGDGVSTGWKHRCWDFKQFIVAEVKSVTLGVSIMPEREAGGPRRGDPP